MDYLTEDWNRKNCSTDPDPSSHKNNYKTYDIPTVYSVIRCFV